MLIIFFIEVFLDLVFSDNVIVVFFFIGIFWWIVNIDSFNFDIIFSICVNILIILVIYKINVNFWWLSILLFIGNIVFLYL